MRSSAFCFNFAVSSSVIKSSSGCLLLILRLLVTSILLFIFLWITCFRRQFLRKMWPIQLAFLLFIVCRMFLVFWLFVMLLHFTHELCGWSFSSFSSTTFQNLQGISDLPSEMSQFSAPYKVVLKVASLLSMNQEIPVLFSWKRRQSCVWYVEVLMVVWTLAESVEKCFAVCSSGKLWGSRNSPKRYVGLLQIISANGQSSAAPWRRVLTSKHYGRLTCWHTFDQSSCFFLQ